MRITILRALSSGGVGVLMFAAVSCGSVEADRTFKFVAPQTGSLIPRRVLVKTAQGADAKSKKLATKREKSKAKSKTKRPPTPVDDDYMSRGGSRFRERVPVRKWLRPFDLGTIALASLT